MSQENVDLVRAGFSAFERSGDVNEVLELMADQVVRKRQEQLGDLHVRHEQQR
jgi:hypothetical protein